MYTVETTVVITVVMVSLSMFLNFAFNLERKVYKNINDNNENLRKEYTIEGKRTFVPEKIQRIIKNINYINKEEK